MIDVMPVPGTTRTVEAGTIIALRLFDVAYAIDLARVEAIGAERAEVGRLRLARADPKAIALRDPPVEIALGKVALPGPGEALAAEAVARLYDFGVISIAFRHAVGGLAWADYVERARAVALAARGDWGPFWTEQLDGVRERFALALTKATAPGIEEDYLFSIVERFDRPLLADELPDELDLVPLLSGERRELSQGARRDLLSHTFSYYRDDLAVVTWDQAFLLEPRGELDVADVLEVANAQLLELRYYDELLDRELPRMYDRVEATRRRLPALARGRYSRLARELHVLVAEVTEITERIDNVLKVTEDVYLARIYGAALGLFRVSSWAGDVDRKLEMIRHTYSALHEEANTGRAELLEMSIVLLIMLEIVLVVL